jgi:hypothetical protein
MDRVDIQVQDISGNWRTYNVIMSATSMQIQMAMKQLKDQFPEQRIRAVDDNGRLVDLLV